MKVAVTYKDGEVFQHFGHTEEFKIYEIENKEIINSEVVSTNGQGHGALSGFLTQRGVSVLICGGIGGGAKSALAQAGITLFGGTSGKADDLIKDYIAGTISYNPNVSCSHHGEGHVCSSNGEHHEHSCGNK